MPKQGDKKRRTKKQRFSKPTKQVNFNSWAKSRREARKGKKPWKGVFRDPVKLSLKGVIMGYR